MKVFNLTDRAIDYRGRIIPPYGSGDYDITFLPDRDKKLQNSKILSFGSLPKGWKKPERKKQQDLSKIAAVAADLIRQTLTEESVTRQMVKPVPVEENDIVKEETKQEYKKKRF